VIDIPPIYLVIGLLGLVWVLSRLIPSGEGRHQREAREIQQEMQAAKDTTNMAERREILDKLESKVASYYRGGEPKQLKNDMLKLGIDWEGLRDDD